MLSRKLLRTQIKIIRFYRRLGLSENRIFFFLSIVIGGMCGLTAVGFHLLTRGLVKLCYGVTDADSLTRPRAYIIIIPMIGGMLAGLVMKFSPAARGSGVPQVRVALLVHKGRIPFKNILGKIFAGALCIGTGSSVGREGPTIQICAGIASFVGRALRLSKDKAKDLVPLGAAAGLAAAFNTPIAAVTFTMEEIIGDLNVRTLGSIILAAVTADVVEHSMLQNNPIFATPRYTMVSARELPIYAVLGVVSALVSVLFSKGLLEFRNMMRREIYVPPYLKTALGGLVIGLFGFFITPRILGVGYFTVREALTNNLTLTVLAFLAFAKLLTTINSYGTGASGGVFGPSLYIGSMVGGSIGQIAHHYFPVHTSNPGAYALVGMGALTAGFIRAPITSILIIFEMTRQYDIILPLMIANITSYSLARLLYKHSIYEALTEQDGIHLPDTESPTARSLTVADAMTKKVVSLYAGWTLRAAAEMLSNNHDKTLAHVGTLDLKRKVHWGDIGSYPLTDSYGKLVGIVSVTDLENAVRKQQLSAKLDSIGTTENIAHVHPDQTLDRALRRLGERDVHMLPVVSREDPKKLLGVITLSDIMRAYRINNETFEPGKVAKVDITEVQ
ncbi:MAG TPA: chloride channel protein [Blastocatellia bacterium]|nr:chloride channel protein [Blastocatellia bacterium]